MTPIEQAFIALRARGIFATLQTLPSGFRVTLQKANGEPCWGVGQTFDGAMAAALLEYERGKK